MLEGRHLMCAPVRDPGDKTMTIAAAQNNAPPADSYACGATEVPLIEQTIGAFFADMVARQPELTELELSDEELKALGFTPPTQPT